MKRRLTKDYFVNICKVIEPEPGQFMRWSNREGKYIPFKLTPNTTKHPYGTDRTYIFCNLHDFSTGKNFGYPYHRFLWIWTYGDCPENYDIHHIDGNTYNNIITNLAVISRKENLKLRRGKKNQHK